MPSKNKIVEKLKTKQKQKVKQKLAQQHMKDSKKKEAKDSKEKTSGGAGSRGGVIVGYTNSGNPRYDETARIPGVTPSKTKPVPKKKRMGGSKNTKRKDDDKKEDKVKKSIEDFIQKYKNKG